MGVENEKRLRHRLLRMPSPAMFVALLALFIGLTSGAYATVQFKHGPKGIVNAQDIAFDSITGAEVKNHSLFPVDLSSSALRKLKGLRGARGDAGTNGTNGTNGINGINGINGFGRLDYNNDGPWFNGFGEVSFGYALCDPGLYATGGGVIPEESSDQYVIAELPTDKDGHFSATGWGVLVGNTSTTTNHTFQVYVICANASQLTKAKSSGALSKIGTTSHAIKAK
jgi:hypothetical protein